MGQAIQFRGAKTVLKAFENYRDAEVWAIFQGKDLNFKGSGTAELETILSVLEEQGSDGIYKLKVYEDISDPKQVKEKTEADGSFSFRLGEDGLVGSLSRSSYIRSLEDKIKKYENEDDEEDKTVGGKILSGVLGLIENPTELVQVIGAFKTLFAPQQPAYNMQPATIGRVMPDFPQPAFPQPQQIITQPENINEVAKAKKETPQAQQQSTDGFVENITDDAVAERLAVAVNKLHKADNEIVTHLEKLAAISEKNPQLFKMLLGSLDTMQ